MVETVNSVQFADSDMYGPDVALDNDENEMYDEEHFLGGLDDDDDEEDDVDAPAIDQEAINWVYKMNPVEWALSYDGGYRWGVLTSNDAECFNSVLKGFMAYLPDEVPFLSHSHRSDSIWEDPDQVRTGVACRRGDSDLWERPLDHRVLQWLLRAGFYGVYRIGHIRLDHPLITALVERWRTETHTFHFSTGEATVTLQDVSVLYGLWIDGRAVTGPDPPFTMDQWIALCAELLGVAPTPADLQTGRVRVRWLSEQFQGHLPDHAPDELVQQHARAYILWIIGESQNLLKLMYLPLLRDIDVIGQYSWGVAALACLYRQLCRAALIWAWERLIRIAPSRRQVVAPGEVPIGQGDMQLSAGP
ncbi:serine/threonine-protein phosphatase 7 long form homolog [Camellia sinensis]|uniref:serine/threonine-protein phosphatase 7 long form homolog n=1 Tax=Camellia sinensis TaxID=4442 RepID=UPI001035E80D|nr:serine/threonine-protein phosphatase 7 long form homolog [Camellia sinensis]